MDKLKNYAVISFTNPILLDIFGHYMKNSVLASFVSESGVVNLKFRVKPPVDPPKSCEQVLSLIYALLESNPESPAGKAYSEHMKEILRETLYRLAFVLDGFGDVKLSIHTSENGVEQHTEFTLTKTRHSG